MALPVRRTDDLRLWDPFPEFDDLHRRFASIMESAFGDLRAEVGAWTPQVDIEETDEAYVVEVDLPGVRAKDIKVELEDNRLSVHGEIKERERTGVLRRSTRRTGQFDYRVALPVKVDPDKVEASLEDGVLRLELAKAEVAKPKRIEITS